LILQFAAVAAELHGEARVPGIEEKAKR